MNFNSRQTYLVAVTMWNQRYLDQLKRVRVLKLAFKETQRAFSKAGGDRDYYDLKSEERAGYSKAVIAMENARSDLYAAGTDTRELELERANSRIEANRQYHANRT